MVITLQWYLNTPQSSSPYVLVTAHAHIQCVNHPWLTTRERVTKKMLWKQGVWPQRVATEVAWGLGSNRKRIIFLSLTRSLSLKLLYTWSTFSQGLVNSEEGFGELKILSFGGTSARPNLWKSDTENNLWLVKVTQRSTSLTVSPEGKNWLNTTAIPRCDRPSVADAL